MDPVLSSRLFFSSIGAPVARRVGHFVLLRLRSGLLRCWPVGQACERLINHVTVFGARRERQSNGLLRTTSGAVARR